MTRPSRRTRALLPRPFLCRLRILGTTFELHGMLLVHSAPRSCPIRDQSAPHTEVPAGREGTSLLTELELPWGRCTPVKSGFESLEVDCLIVPGNLARAKSLKDRRHWVWLELAWL